MPISLAHFPVVVTINVASAVGGGRGRVVGRGVAIVVAVIVVANMVLPFPGFWVLQFGNRQGHDRPLLQVHEQLLVEQVVAIVWK